MLGKEYGTLLNPSQFESPLKEKALLLSFHCPQKTCKCTSMVSAGGTLYQPPRQINLKCSFGSKSFTFLERENCNFTYSLTFNNGMRSCDSTS